MVHDTVDACVVAHSEIERCMHALAKYAVTCAKNVWTFSDKASVTHSQH